MNEHSVNITLHFFFFIDAFAEFEYVCLRLIAFTVRQYYPPKCYRTGRNYHIHATRVMIYSQLLAMRRWGGRG